ncbi:hypothetical protein, partial [Actinoplanes derwentensis]|uniref:hypothetical protein n=1 Tax=Actinoplanes derwentensis TaxID=113562 RepID=UPI0019443D58
MSAASDTATAMTARRICTSMNSMCHRLATGATWYFMVIYRSARSSHSLQFAMFEVDGVVVEILS